MYALIRSTHLRCQTSTTSPSAFIMPSLRRCLSTFLVLPSLSTSLPPAPLPTSLPLTYIDTYILVRAANAVQVYAGAEKEIPQPHHHHPPDSPSCLLLFFLRQIKSAVTPLSRPPIPSPPPSLPPFCCQHKVLLFVCLFVCLL